MNPRGCITGNTDKHHVDYALSYPRKDRWSGHLHPVGRPGRCRNFWIKVQSAGNSYFNYYRGSRSGSSSEGTRVRRGPCTQDVDLAEATAHREAATHFVLRRMNLTCGDVRV